MKKILHTSFFLVLNFLLFVRLWSADVYTTSLDIRTISNHIIELKWKANTKRDKFVIFRSSKMFSEPEDLKTALKIWEQTVKGEESGSLYSFPAVNDTPKTNGNYYYIVLPHARKYEKSMMQPGINLTLWPATVSIENEVLSTNTNKVPEANPWVTALTNQDTVRTNIITTELFVTNTFYLTNTSQDITNLVTVVITNEEQPVVTNTSYLDITNTRVITNVKKLLPENGFREEVIPELAVSKLQIRRKSNSFFLLWSLNKSVEDDVQFLIYREAQPISSIKGLRPYKIIDNELFFEDFNLELGKKYYYAVILANNPVIKQGSNMNLQAISFVDKSKEISVEQEVYYERIQLSDLKTNVIVTKLKKKNNDDLKRKTEETTQDLNDKRSGISQDEWADLQGEERPGYLLLTKGLSGKNNQKEWEKQRLLEEQYKRQKALADEKRKKMEEAQRQKQISQQLEWKRKWEEEKRKLDELNQQLNKKQIIPEQLTNAVTREVVLTNVIDVFKPVYITNTHVVNKGDQNIIVITNTIIKEVEQKNKQPEQNNAEPEEIKKQGPGYVVDKEIYLPDEKKYIYDSEKFVSDKYKESNAPETNPQALKQAENLYIAKEYNKVLQLLSRDQSWQARFLKGKSFYFLGQYRPALREFKKLKKFRPQTADLWIRMTMNRWGEEQ